MARFRVKDLMISVGLGDDDEPCWLITNCGGVTELCVENTQGCAFTDNCNCTIATPCNEFTCNEFTCGFCSICSPCSQRTCLCSGCTGRSMCTVRSLCGVTVRCTPTFAQTGRRRLEVEDLTELKRELRAALDRVEAEEQRLAESESPQTLDEVTQLEEKLQEALGELQRRRGELENQPADETE